MAKYECKICGYVFDEQQAGESFDEIYSCPICDADKSMFVNLDGDESEKEMEDGEAASEDKEETAEEIKNADDSVAEEETGETVTGTNNEFSIESDEKEEADNDALYADIFGKPFEFDKSDGTEEKSEEVSATEDETPEPTEEKQEETPVVADDTAEPEEEKEEVKDFIDEFLEANAAKEENKGFVIEKRQEFWKKEEIPEKDNEEKNVDSIMMNHTGSIFKVIGSDTEYEERKEPENEENNHANNGLIQTFYTGNPVKSEEEIKSAEESKESSEFKPFFGSGMGTIQRVLGAPETNADSEEEFVFEDEDKNDEIKNEENVQNDSFAEAKNEDAAEEVKEEQTEEVPEEATEEQAEKAVEETTEEKVEESFEEATEEPVEEAGEEATEEPAEETFEEATEEKVEEIFEAANEEQPEEVFEEATEEHPEEAFEEATEEQAEEIFAEEKNTDEPVYNYETSDNEEMNENVSFENAGEKIPDDLDFDDDDDDFFFEEADEDMIDESENNGFFGVQGGMVDVPAEELKDDAEEAPAEDIFTEEAEAPAEDIFAEETEAPVGDIFAEEAEEAPVGEIFAEEAEAPAEEIFAEEAEAPAEEIFAEETEAPAEEIFTEEAEVPAEEIFTEEAEVPAEDGFTEEAEAPAENEEYISLDSENAFEDDGVVFLNLGDANTDTENEEAEYTDFTQSEEDIIDNAEETDNSEVSFDDSDEIEDDAEYIDLGHVFEDNGNEEINSEEIIEEVEETQVAYSMLKSDMKYTVLYDNEAKKIFDDYPVVTEKVSNGLENIILLPAQCNPLPLDRRAEVETKTVIGALTACPVEVLQPFCFSKLFIWGEHIPNNSRPEEYNNQALVLVKGEEGHIPNLSSKEELKEEVAIAKARFHGTPVGIDLVAGRIEADLEACVYAKVDFVILNDVSSRILPYALRRARNYLNRVNSKLEILVCVEALKDAQELAKILALGANFVLVESGFDLNMANDMTEALKEICRSTGHSNVHDLNLEDICTIDTDLAMFTDISHV